MRAEDIFKPFVDAILTKHNVQRQQTTEASKAKAI